MSSTLKILAPGELRGDMTAIGSFCDPVQNLAGLCFLSSSSKPRPTRYQTALQGEDLRAKGEQLREEKFTGQDLRQRSLGFRGPAQQTVWDSALPSV